MTRDHLRSRSASVVMVMAIVVAVFGATAVIRWGFEPDAAAEETTTTTSTVVEMTTTTVGPHVAVSTQLASPNGKVPRYDGPNGRQVGEVGVWYGYPMTLPILEEQGEWLRVMVPERPNQDSGWIRASDATRSSTAYRIVTDLASTTATVYKDGFPYFSFHFVAGKASTPTPTGSYFVAVVERDVPGGYGSVVLDLSAHSEAIQSWKGSGDAIIAFHGPFGSESRIREGGAFLSNGCLRMLPDDQIKLAEIPVGTPVDIV